MIACSEKCIHQKDGICTLNKATKPSNTPIKDCPYFEDIKEKKEES